MGNSIFFLRFCTRKRSKTYAPLFIVGSTLIASFLEKFRRTSSPAWKLALNISRVFELLPNCRLMLQKIQLGICDSCPGEPHQGVPFSVKNIGYGFSIWSVVTNLSKTHCYCISLSSPAAVNTFHRSLTSWKAHTHTHTHYISIYLSKFDRQAIGRWDFRKWFSKLTVQTLGSRFSRPTLGCCSLSSTFNENSISPDSGLNLLLEVFRLPWVMHRKSTASSSCCLNWMWISF